MADLYAAQRYRQQRNLVLDVRSRSEYRAGHVPGSLNAPLARLAREPGRFAPDLAVFEQVFVHCSTGARARRARDALAAAGLRNLVLIERSGMRDWPGPVERGVSLTRDLITGLAAGLLAQLAVAPLDRALMPVRSDSPHKVASEKLGVAFPIGYGLLWGAVYALTRRRVPQAGALLGLPFAAAFYLLCDGVLAPLFRIGPTLDKIPARFNAKELANHVAWTAAAEAVQRGAQRLPG